MLFINKHRIGIFMKYSEIRKVFLIFISFALIGLLLFTAAIKKESIGFVIFLIILVGFILKAIETIIIKCHGCKKRPLSILKKFPKKCPHCGKNLTDDI
jgi:hypothetical protein